MAANFAQMNQQRQTPQGRPGVPMNNVQEHILRSLNLQAIPNSGWQSQVLIQDRMGSISSLLGNLRLASQHQANVSSMQKMVEMGIAWEKEMFFNSPDREHYKREVEKKQLFLQEKRNQNQAHLQQQISQQANAQAQAQQMMMNQNAMQGQLQRAMLQQPGQQVFHQLQHQMQASPLPGQQNMQMNMGMPIEAAQSMGNQPFQMPIQQSQQQPNFPGRPTNAQPQLSPQENDIVTSYVNRAMTQGSAEEKNNIRARIQATMDPSTLQALQSQNMDPLVLHYRSIAVSKLRENRQNRMNQMAMAQGQNMPTSAPMQLQRSMNPSPLNGQAQQTPMNGNQEFMSFMGNNMDNIAVQQQQGVIAQEAGQMVVPASGAPRNGTPQPGMPGQQMNMNARNQQQMFSAQQAQQQRIQQGAQPQPSQQQSQLQARQMMQQKAQQLGLQGQGANVGPMPAQQSPAMGSQGNLLRTPSQQMNQPEPPISSNGQFGQPLDQRFLPGNQRAMNGFSVGLFPGMPPEQAQKYASLPRDKLTEVVARWNQRGQQMNANAQGRPGMPVQGNGQVRPGQQMPQPGQFNQNGNSQFNNGNPGQQPTPAMLQALNQQQMARLAQNPLQQQNMSQNSAMERAIMQMENVDFPPTLLNSGNLPRGIPPDIKKWGPLKQWAQQNPALGPEVVNKLAHLQRLHYQTIVRSRNQQQPNAAMGMQPGPQGPMVPATHPGMPAPVAPMAQNPTPAPGSMRQPTQQDIQSLRHHPSGKMLNATDDQIRTVWMRQTMVQAQMNLRQQHPQPYLQQQMPNPANGQPQGMQATQPPNSTTALPLPQSQQADTSAITPSQTARARPQQPPRSAPQPSSSQPVKNLKRASSDEVVEVPNPNTQHRATAAAPQVQKPPGQPPQLTPEQISQLAPDARAKYEQFMRRIQQAKQQPGQLTAAETEKLKAMMREEQSALANVVDIPMDERSKALMSRMLLEMVNPLHKVGKALSKWYVCTHDDNRTRKFFRTQLRLRSQFVDSDMKQLKDTFSITPREIDEAKDVLQKMVQDLSERYPTMKKPDVAQTPQPAPGPTTAPLNAANLEQQQKQLNLMHQRSNSRSQVAPAAPTTSHPPIQFGAPSPHGTPIYNGKHPAVTQENLHIPRKKQKPNNTPAAAQSTPGSTSSPQVKQMVTPEVKKESKPPAKPSLTCSEPECDRHTVGFDSEEALRKHTQQEHIKPLEDPKRFVLETLASATALDEKGRPKMTAAEEAAGAKMAISGSKQGQTTKDTPAATPMFRNVSFNRQASGAFKAGPQVKGKDLAKDDSTKAQVAKEPQQKATAPVEEAIDPWVNSTIDPNDIVQNFQQFESVAGGAIADANVYRSITPNDTPESSKDGVSEPTSDITDGVALDVHLDIIDDTWQPFGGSEVNDAKALFGLEGGDGMNDAFMMEDSQPMGAFQWDDSMDQMTFDAPFSFDTSQYSMNVD